MLTSNENDVDHHQPNAVHVVRNRPEIVESSIYHEVLGHLYIGFIYLNQETGVSRISSNSEMRVEAC